MGKELVCVICVRCVVCDGCENGGCELVLDIASEFEGCPGV